MGTSGINQDLESLATSGQDSAESESDILRPCAGECGQKILFFGFPGTGEEWTKEIEGALCMECRSKPLKHIPVKRSNDD